MIDTGSTGFMLLACSLVMLMTPGLAFFYGGLATKRNILAIMIQSFFSLGWTTVLWFVFGLLALFQRRRRGNPGQFRQSLLNGVGNNSMYSNGKIPKLFSLLTR
jgi:Amt family ammonium transporter